MTAPAALTSANEVARAKFSWIRALKPHEHAILTSCADRWRWYGMAGCRAPDLHFRNFLLSLDFAPAAPPEKMAGHARSAQDRGQGNHQRWPARNDHRSQG